MPLKYLSNFFRSLEALLIICKIHLELYWNNNCEMNGSIGMIRKLQQIILRAVLLTIYKSFLRPHLDYGDVIYDHALNESFQNKLEPVQYNAV